MTISKKSSISSTAQKRKEFIAKSFTDNYEALMKGDPNAWKGKFRKMAESPFAFYRGSAALFYADVSKEKDPFLNKKTSRVWIQGDLHAENFGTYMNGKGVFIFDVNDFDEAYVAPFNWDVKRFCASLALIGYQKAMSDVEIREIVGHAARSYARQVARFAEGQDKDFALNLRNTKGPLLSVLHEARGRTRFELLDMETDIVDGDRRFKSNKFIAPVTDKVLRSKIEAAFKEYYDTIPSSKKRSEINYEIKDVALRRGLGIGSAGLKIYSILLEGDTEALENDIIISMKNAQPSAAMNYVKHKAEVSAYFKNEGHRTAVSQRALQANADPFLGHATLDGMAMFVTEVSPYCADLEWSDLNDLDSILEVVEYLGQCIAKIHCCSDDDSDQTLITYSIEEAINEVLDGKEAEYVQYMQEFGERYALQVREDYRLFIDAFRNHEIGGI